MAWTDSRFAVSDASLHIQAEDDCAALSVRVDERRMKKDRDKDKDHRKLAEESIFQLPEQPRPQIPLPVSAPVSALLPSVWPAVLLPCLCPSALASSAHFNQVTLFLRICGRLLAGSNYVCCCLPPARLMLLSWPTRLLTLLEALLLWVTHHGCRMGARTGSRDFRPSATLRYDACMH